MNEYLILAAGMILLPGIYICLTFWQTEKFNGMSKFEVIVLAAAEIAFLRMWRTDSAGEVPYILSEMKYVMLAFMTYFCVEDHKEQLVPNRVLLLLLVLFPILLGGYGIHDMDTVLKIIPSIILGFLFCLISFGLGYLLSHGSMGAGDVKLSLIMGIYLTGNDIPGAIFYGCLIAAGYSIVQLLRKKISIIILLTRSIRRLRIHFCPYRNLITMRSTGFSFLPTVFRSNMNIHLFHLTKCRKSGGVKG